MLVWWENQQEINTPQYKPIRTRTSRNNKLQQAIYSPIYRKALYLLCFLATVLAETAPNTPERKNTIDNLKNFSWKRFFCHLCSGLCVIAGMVLISLPFGLAKVLSQYASTLDSYTFATMNAFNFWALVGMNGIDQSTGFLFLPARVWGSLAILLIIVFSFIIAKRSQNASYKYYMIGAFSILTMFTFSVRMHERYISPGIALLAFLLIYKPIKQLWICYSALSVLTYYNIEWVLEDYGDLVFHNDVLLTRLVAAGIVGSLIYFYYVIKKYCLCNTSS